MKWFRQLGRISSAWRWLAAVTIGLALISVPAASAASSGSATIMVFAPGAAQGDLVQVEWFDPITLAWVPVTGWTGTLNQTTGSGTPFQAFAVLPENYGQSAFRWVVYSPASNMAQSANPMMTTASTATTSTTTSTSANTTVGTNTTTAANTNAASSLWGVSSPFSLPNTDGITLQTTILPMQVLSQLNTIVGTPTTATSTNTFVNSTPSLIIASLNCPTGCNASAITAKFTGLPMSSWITVEWLDSQGVWEPVLGWQGQADYVDASGHLVKQFGVFQRNYGQGPFRWAVYNAPNGGSLIAVSPNFNLPSADGQNEILNLAG